MGAILSGTLNSGCGVFACGNFKVHNLRDFGAVSLFGGVHYGGGGIICIIRTITTRFCRTAAAGCRLHNGDSAGESRAVKNSHPAHAGHVLSAARQQFSALRFGG